MEEKTCLNCGGELEHLPDSYKDSGEWPDYECVDCGADYWEGDFADNTTDWRSQLTDDERQLLADIQAADSPLGGSQLVKRLASLLDEIRA
jgi:hypothetical protein